MKKPIRLLSIIIAILGIGILLLAAILNLSSIVWIIGTIMLIGGALTGAFLEKNGENNIGSYRIPKI